MTDRKTTLILADDHANVRRSVRALLEDEPDLAVVAETDSGREAVRLVDALHPDILLLDMLLGDLSGIEVAFQVKAASPQTNVVIFSMYGSRSYIAGSRQAGAHGYLLKKSAPEDLVKILRVVSMGGEYYAAPSSPD